MKLERGMPSSQLIPNFKMSGVRITVADFQYRMFVSDIRSARCQLEEAIQFFK